MQTIAIDFDGVIHKYSKGWQDGSCYDNEISGVFETIQELMKNYTVFIFSTRNPKQIKKWMQERIMQMDMGDNPKNPKSWSFPKYGYTVEIIPWWKPVKFWNKQNVIGITRKKLPAMCYIDDRALRFNGDWKETIGRVKTFKTYQEIDRQINEGLCVKPRISADNICSITKEICDDECCPPGAECNISGNSITDITN